MTANQPEATTPAAGGNVRTRGVASAAIAALMVPTVLGVLYVTGLMALASDRRDYFPVFAVLRHEVLLQIGGVVWLFTLGTATVLAVLIHLAELFVWPFVLALAEWVRRRRTAVVAVFAVLAILLLAGYRRAERTLWIDSAWVVAVFSGTLLLYIGPERFFRIPSARDWYVTRRLRTVVYWLLMSAAVLASMMSAPLSPRWHQVTVQLTTPNAQGEQVLSLRLVGPGYDEYLFVDPDDNLVAIPKSNIALIKRIKESQGP